MEGTKYIIVVVQLNLLRAFSKKNQHVNTIKSFPFTLRFHNIIWEAMDLSFKLLAKNSGFSLLQDTKHNMPIMKM